MKRIAICIIIGIACSLITFAFVRLSTGRSKKNRSNQQLYNAELKIRIGVPGDDNRAVTTTLTQIRNRTEPRSKFTSKKLGKNDFLLSINRVDTNLVKKMVSESAELRFLETFLTTEIAEALSKVESELTLKKKLALDSADKNSVLTDPENIEIKKKGACNLYDLVNFFQPFQDVNGKLLMPAGLGTIKAKDTIYLNKILNDEQIRNKFPINLVFVYGKEFGNRKNEDSSLTIYAIKIIDPAIYPFPTSANVSGCRVFIEPMTERPAINLSFDARGADAWQSMTARNIGRPIVLLVNDLVLSAPIVESEIQGGESRIMGDFTFDEADYLRTMLASGRLALPVEILESKFEPAKKMLSALWMFGLVFLLSTLLAYAISFLLKPAPKP